MHLLVWIVEVLNFCLCELSDPKETLLGSDLIPKGLTNLRSCKWQFVAPIIKQRPARQLCFEVLRLLRYHKIGNADMPAAPRQNLVRHQSGSHCLDCVRLLRRVAAAHLKLTKMP